MSRISLLLDDACESDAIPKTINESMNNNISGSASFCCDSFYRAYENPFGIHKLDSCNSNSNNNNNRLEDVKRDYTTSANKSDHDNGSRYADSSNNNKLTSYSKILRQYLPDSLNLNALDYVSNINSNITATRKRCSNINSNIKCKDRKPHLDGSRAVKLEQQFLVVGVEREKKQTVDGVVVVADDSRKKVGQNNGQTSSSSSSSSSNNNNNDYDHHNSAPVFKSSGLSVVDALNRINSKSNRSSSVYKFANTDDTSACGGLNKCNNSNNARHRLSSLTNPTSDEDDQLVPSYAGKSEFDEPKSLQNTSHLKQNYSGDWWKRRIRFLYLKDFKSGSDSTNSTASSQPKVKILTDKSSTTTKSKTKFGKLSKRNFDLNNNYYFGRSSKHTIDSNPSDGHRLISDSEEEQEEPTVNKSLDNSKNMNCQTQDTNNNNNNNDNSNKSQPRKPTKPAAKTLESPTTGIGSSCYGLALGLVLVSLLVSSRLVIGQQHSAQPPPGFRSHSPNGLPLAPASAPNQPSGLLQATNSPSNRPSPQPAAGSLVANVNCNKIRGHVTFTPNAQAQGGATVSTHITEGPPGEVYQWSIHQFPVKPGAAMCTCSPMILGSKLVDLSELHGNLPSNQEFSVQTSIPIFGFDSPIGHSLLLRGLKTGVMACATFLPTSRKANYRAKFHQPLSGSITVFQTAFGTSFLSHLMYSNGTRRHSTHRFDIFKSDDDVMSRSLLSGAQVGSFSSVSPASQTVQEQREHENELTQCRRFTSGEPLFRNMTYQLTVSTENFGMRSRTALVLPQIPFETFSSVYVIIYSEHNSNEPIACAPLKFVKPKTAAAKFQTVSVQGSVVFSQESPYDPTISRINLQLPNSDGHSYGIDELPMIIRRKSDTRVCPNIREIIYNPHHIEPSSVPPEGEATSDQYAVGDLSGKYGSLAGKSSEKIQVNDHNLPLFGPNSIIGRAMTIYSADGVAIACSNVELTSPMTTAFATFDFGVQGQFIFRQPQNDCNGDTYVYIEVSKPMASNSGSSHSSQFDHQQPRTLDHNWHIHLNPVDSGLDHLSTTECSAAGPHFNPYNTSTGNTYTRDCTPFNVLRCELGDLASKMFTLEIPPYRVKGAQEPEIGKFFGTDIDLPLCGPVSIVNRSVVVHTQDFGVQRMACSTVIEFKPRT